MLNLLNVFPCFFSANNRLQLTAGACGVFQISHFQSGNRVIVSSLLTAASTKAGVRILGEIFEPDFTN